MGCHMNTRNRNHAGAVVAQCADEDSCTRIACEVCLTEVPADAVNVTDAQDYVHHFCGLGCLETWQKQAETPQKDAPPEPANRIK